MAEVAMLCLLLSQSKNDSVGEYGLKFGLPCFYVYETPTCAIVQSSQNSDVGNYNVTMVTPLVLLLWDQENSQAPAVII